VVQEGDDESSTLLSVSRIVQARHHALMPEPEPGPDHFPEVGDGELVDENLNRFIRKTRANYVPKKQNASNSNTYVLHCGQPMGDGLCVHTEQWT
jgi:hypothetical protein